MKKNWWLVVVTMFALLGCGGVNDPGRGEEVSATSAALDSAGVGASAKTATTGTSYRLVSVDAQLRDGLLRVEATISASSDPLDRFRIVRVAPPSPRAGRRGSVLLLPSLNCNAVEYEWTDAGVGYRQSPAGYLADHGYDVWLFSPRTTSVVAGACAVAGSCAVATGWGMTTYVADIDFERSVMEVLRPGERPFVGGLSLGGMLTYATINAHGARYAGAVIWEAMLLSHDAAFVAGFAPVCAHGNALVAAGQPVDDGFGSLATAAYNLAVAAPAAPSPIGIFPGFDNQQTFVALFATPNPALPVPARGFIINAADPTSNYERFRYTNDSREGQQILTGNYYESVRLERDFECSLAGVETGFTNHLSAFTRPVLAIEAGLGFGSYMADNLAALGSTDRTVIYTPSYGHADHLLSTSYKTDAVLPILAWLNVH